MSQISNDKKILELLNDRDRFDAVWSGMSTEQRNEMESIAMRNHMLDTLKKMRKKIGMTQNELSQKSGIPRPTISKIESGKRNVTIDTLTALAAAMGKRIELNFV